MSSTPQQSQNISIPDLRSRLNGEVIGPDELPEPIEDLESVRIDVLARKGVLRAWDDPGRYHSREL